MARVFRYEEIAAGLRGQIERSEFPNDRLPSERVLMQQYDVQRDTVRRALTLLEAEGRIITEGKRGSFVVPSVWRELPDVGGILIAAAKAGESTARDDIVRGLNEAVQTSGRPIVYFDPAENRDRVVHRLPTPEYLRAHRIEGVILWPNVPADVELLRRLRAEAPLVLIDRRVLGFEADFVGFDDFSGGRMATEHLLRQGRRRIGFLSSDPSAETVQERWRGYTAALESAGIRADPAWIFQSYGLGALNESMLNAYLRIFLESAGGPLTAVVCGSDAIAARLIQFLRAEGRRVPEDVAVTGYGNLLPTYLDALGLTTIDQSFTELGRKAGERLLDRLGGKGDSPPSPGGYREVRLPAHLIVRGSCGGSR